MSPLCRPSRSPSPRRHVRTRDDGATNGPWAPWSTDDIQASVDVVSVAYEEVPFSELLHHPAATARRLDEVRALRLRRRGATDLALMRVDQMERDSVVVDFATSMLAGLIRTGNTAALRQALPDALPWTIFLPPEDVDTFFTELIETARGAMALNTLAPIAALLSQWRHSAEIHADPDLYTMLTREPDGDLGPVPRPSGTSGASGPTGSTGASGARGG
ncbi:hypothetical protein Ga0074812_10251 [Parafrankia irregularis]|uniref:Uncharacterized protein n=1 Tax=Parafrankia irregularis TaxID=795642 RepID=A0A0S4QEW6_9ACTN|nr:hypothetical protein [Parafrankia sp. CH37]CUU54048.1 hypothetical protein Ga0074812_10251 [Parafrankia irregularis]